MGTMRCYLHSKENYRNLLSRRMQYEEKRQGSLKGLNVNHLQDGKQIIVFQSLIIGGKGESRSSVTLVPDSERGKGKL